MADASSSPDFPVWLEQLVSMSSGIAVADWDSVQTDLINLKALDCDPDRVEEAILQSYLFAGFPAALTASQMWRAILGRAAADADSLAQPPSVSAWEERGAIVCRTVYGSAYMKLRANVAAIHPALDRWMVSEGYGKVLGRPGLDLAHRELCIVGLLAAGVWDDQLYSHLRGALLAGAPVASVSRALQIGLMRVQEPDTSRLNNLWNLVQRGTNGGQDVH